MYGATIRGRPGNRTAWLRTLVHGFSPSPAPTVQFRANLMKFGAHNPSRVYGPDPAAIFEGTPSVGAMSREQRLRMVLGPARPARPALRREPSFFETFFSSGA